MWSIWSREQVLNGEWTPAAGVSDLTTDLPDDWAAALRRLGRDLRVRQYGGQLDHIEWVGEYDDEAGAVQILTNVTPRGRRPNGSSGHCTEPIDSDQESIAVYIAVSVQDAIGGAGIAWPWGVAGGFLRPCIEDTKAVWYDGRQSRIVARIGDLTERSGVSPT